MSDDVGTDDDLAQGADALFARYHSLGQDEHVAATVRFAEEGCPYYDERRGRWLVANHDNARLVLRDDRFGNSLDRARSATNSAQLNRQLRPEAPSLLFVDPPEHDAIKAQLALLFT